MYSFRIAIVPTACGMRRRGPAEEQSDDEARTSLGPDQREGKTEVIKQQCLSFTVLKQLTEVHSVFFDWSQLQQHLSLAVCDEGCQQRSKATMRSVHLQSITKGKTEVMMEQDLPFTVLRHYYAAISIVIHTHGKLQQHLLLGVLNSKSFDC